MMEQGGRPCYIDLPYPQVTPWPGPVGSVPVDGGL